MSYVSKSRKQNLLPVCVTVHVPKNKLPHKGQAGEAEPGKPRSVISVFLGARSRMSHVLHLSPEALQASFQRYLRCHDVSPADRGI